MKIESLKKLLDLLVKNFTLNFNKINKKIKGGFKMLLTTKQTYLISYFENFSTYTIKTV